MSAPASRRLARRWTRPARRAWVDGLRPAEPEADVSQILDEVRRPR